MSVNVRFVRVAAVCALVLAPIAACGGSSGSVSDGRGGAAGVDQSEPGAFATSVVNAARNGEDITRYAVIDYSSGRHTARPCTSGRCSDLTSLATASGTCARLKGTLTAHVETANRNDDESVLVHITTADDSSGSCSMHVSKVNGRWWLSD